MTTPAVTFNTMSKHFGQLVAVDRLTLTIAPGEVLGFLGPNGAGKTTTVRTLMGFLHPTAGSCAVFGRWPGRDVAVRRRIGYLPGDFRIDPAMTGAYLFAWYARLRGVPLDRARELAARLDLVPDRRFGTLSKGNRQKVGLVQAFLHDPDLLVLDEPTSGLDPLMQREFLDLVAEAAARGAAVLFSSHVLPEVQRVADRVAIIRSGRLVTVSAVADLLDRARHRLELRYTDPVPDGLLDGVPGVVDTQPDGRVLTVVIDGPVGPALARAAGHGGLVRVDTVGDELEDLFLAEVR